MPPGVLGAHIFLSQQSVFSVTLDRAHQRGSVSHICNLSIWDSKAGRLVQIQGGQPGLQYKRHSQMSHHTDLYSQSEPPGIFVQQTTPLRLSQANFSALCFIPVSDFMNLRQ